MSTITFNDIAINDDTTIFISDDSDWYKVPTRDYDSFTVLGRDGNVIQDNGRYNNMTIGIGIDIVDGGTGSAMHDLLVQMAQYTGYYQLVNSDDPDVYRMAAFAGIDTLSFGQFKKTGQAVVLFDCKPQRFLTQDEDGITVGAFGSEVEFTNPTNFIAKPLIKAYSGAYVRISGTNSFGFSVADLSGLYTDYLYVDAETCECYSPGGADLSDYVTFGTYAYGNDEYPFFKGAGTYTAYDYGADEHAVIYPHWWTI